MRNRKRDSAAAPTPGVAEALAGAKAILDRCAKCDWTIPNPGCTLCRPPKKGRKPRPKRCVIQVRVREGGKVSNFYSCTVLVEPIDAMRVLQEAFFGLHLH